jgi:hypothetical protein
MPTHLIHLSRIGLKVEDLSETARKEAVHLHFHQFMHFGMLYLKMKNKYALTFDLPEQKRVKGRRSVRDSQTGGYTSSFSPLYAFWIFTFTFDSERQICPHI